MSEAIIVAAGAAEGVTLSPVALYLARLSPGTRRRSERTLDAIAAIMAGEPLSATQVPTWRTRTSR